MLYRRFPGCRKRRSAHTTFHDRCQGAQRVASHPPCLTTFGTSRLPSLPLSRRRVLFCGAKRPVELFEGYPNQSSGPGALSQEEESTGRPWMPRGRLFRTLPAHRPLSGALGRVRCHTVRRLCISTLHVSLKIRCCRALNPQRVAFFASPVPGWRHDISKAGISEAFARMRGNDGGGQRYGEKKRVSR